MGSVSNTTNYGGRKWYNMCLTTKVGTKTDQKPWKITEIAHFDLGDRA